MNYLAKAKELQNMVLGGQLMDAFEKFYHEDVVMIEATGDKREGKSTNRKYEEDFLNSIKEFHNAGLVSIQSNEEAKTTSAEIWMDVSFKDGNRVKLEQVAVQSWEGDQIVKERFYYNA